MDRQEPLPVVWKTGSVHDPYAGIEGEVPAVVRGAESLFLLLFAIL